MRNVLVLNQFALPRSQGGGTRHVDLFGRLRDWSPIIITGNRNHYSQQKFTTVDQRFHLVWVPKQTGSGKSRLLGWLIFGFQAFLATMRRPELDIIYGSSPQPLAALAGLIAARLRKIPFVLEVRDLWPESIVAAGHLKENSSIHQVLKAIERLLAKHAAVIVCVTPGWEEHFANLGVSPDRLVIIPNGTEPSDFDVDESRERLRAESKISGFTAIFAGAHGPKDNIDLLLTAAGELPHINFLLVGSGPSKEASLERAHFEGLENVQFRQPVAKQSLARLLLACDVGLHTVAPLAVFDHGMSPNKLFDYMAAGLPIVSNAEHALRKIMRDGECGRTGDSDDFVNCLQEVYEASAAQRDKWGRRSLDILSTTYTRSSAAALLEKTLDSFVSTARRR